LHSCQTFSKAGEGFMRLESLPRFIKACNSNIHLAALMRKAGAVVQKPEASKSNIHGHIHGDM
jgi:hypothetical protein